MDVKQIEKEIFGTDYSDSQVAQAKELLRSKGYFVANLWNVNDVKDNYECNDEQAQAVLYEALTNEDTMEQIWFKINLIALEQGFKQI
jgi:hypothetical protein